MKPIQFNFNTSKEFYNELKTKVKDHFETNNISDKGNRHLYSKTIILFVAWIAAYSLILFVAQSLRAVIGSYILFGLIGGLIGFNVMHDGGHGGYSKKKWLNQLMGYSMNLLGSHLSFWQMQHNVLHHTYTNIDQYDDDIDSRPIFRFHPDQQRKPIHRFQHLYFLPLYGLGIIAMMFYGDYKRYFTRKVGSMKLKKLSLGQHSLFRGTKVAMIAIYFLIPALFVGRWQALLGMFIMFFAMGVVLNTVFQLAHVLEKTQMKSHIDFRIPEHRIVHELQTTANFAMGNKVRTWLLGGLNYQVEHHLFSHISHVHYPKIAPIVQEVCAKYGITYNSYKTITQAFISHIRQIKYLGQHN
ncbi:Stearoyl-CoA 9-desaturase [candidate division SR1 bacterium Aalborg_AAW-1]|nr:Stearoyl-CoA 9-desaturase [candidate division SR1 bacterium Aalborg_AAW-1]